MSKDLRAWGPSLLKRIIASPGAWIALPAIAVFLRLLYQVDFYVPYLATESDNLLRNAPLLRQSFATEGLLPTIRDMALDYSKGFNLVLYPLFAAVGADSRVVIFGVSAIVSLNFGLVAWLHRVVRRDSATLFSWLLVASSILFSVCVRRYKWHGVAHVGVVSALIYFLPDIIKIRDRRWRIGCRVGGLALYVACCFQYFGCFQYAAPIFLLSVLYGGRRLLTRHVLVCGALLGVVAWVHFTVMRLNSAWWDNVTVSLERIFRDRSDVTWQNVWIGTQEFLAYFFSWPFALAGCIGLATLIARAWKKDRFAWFILVFFFWSFGLQVAMWGAQIGDCLNWSMVAFCLIIAAGFDVIFKVLRKLSGKYFVLCAAGLVAGLATYEINQYRYKQAGAGEQWVNYTYNTQAQLALLLRTLTPDDLRKTLLPGATFPISDGGFDRENLVFDVRFSSLIDRIDQFVTRDELRRKLAGAAPESPVVVYLGVPISDSNDTPLLGTTGERIFLGTGVYPEPTPIRRFVFTAPPPPE